MNSRVPFERPIGNLASSSSRSAFREWVGFFLGIRRNNRIPFKYFSKACWLDQYAWSKSSARIRHSGRNVISIRNITEAPQGEFVQKGLAQIWIHRRYFSLYGKFVDRMPSDPPQLRQFKIGFRVGTGHTCLRISSHNAAISPPSPPSTLHSASFVFPHPGQEPSNRCIGSSPRRPIVIFVHYRRRHQYRHKRRAAGTQSSSSRLQWSDAGGDCSRLPHSHTSQPPFHCS